MSKLIGDFSTPENLEFDDYELMNLKTGSLMVFDLESYVNLFVVRFKHLETGKYITFEENPINTYNKQKLSWILWNFCIIGFNSISFDIPLIALAIEGMQAPEIKTVVDRIIRGELKYWEIKKEFNINLPEVNHIDLIEVCPLQGSLKLYGARLHCKTIQDLPYEPSTQLTYDEAQNVKAYLNNDLAVTELVYRELEQEIKLREQLSSEYEQDLRSKSDAQIAESVITKEVYKLTGVWPKKPIINKGDIFYYSIPDYIGFRSLKMNEVLEVVRTAEFIIDESGYLTLSEQIKNLKINIGNSIYQMGMGGLHSTEKSVSHYADENYRLFDVDVESYYPRIILNQNLCPQQMGDAFLHVYSDIVRRRIEAKRNKNTIVSDALKITINGSFGKFGSKYSALYAPDLLLQVTISGQLTLLMLIELLENQGFSVISANTDGIVIKCLNHKYLELQDCIKAFEQYTHFKTEETEYKALLSRDINNYIAIKMDGSCKTKGEYSNPWNDKKTAIFRFHKNPQTTICIEAITNLISKNITIEQTIKNCGDIRKFITVRNVRGGGTFKGSYLGKVVRWYYADKDTDCIRYKGTGNKVAKSDCCKPLMTLPNELPTDINYKWYIDETTSMLFDIGYLKKAKTGKLF